MRSVDFRLLLVTDRTQTRGRSLPLLLRQAVDAGLPAIQLRERDLPTRELLRLGCEIASFTRQGGVSLIVNDRVDLMLAMDLDGVHLRTNSLPISAVRRLVGADRLIGISTHSLAEVQAANLERADYVVFGPVFDTPSKRQFGSPVGLDQLAEACRLSTVPVFAIGGITCASVPAVRRAGAHGVAVIGAILGQDDVAAATHDLLASLAASSDSDVSDVRARPSV
ncbi:MAG: thiamine phosphate synthase [Nitrospira sp.]|nr:thiamine phosphate synthase [Nitrospira sp.]MCP9442896.1 thiamine phosphate synthase [Nitrospira sp.]